MDDVDPKRASARPALGRCLTAAATLLLLFLAGPVHVWHHAAGAVEHVRVGDDGGQCVPCSALQKNSLAPASATPVAWTSVCLGIVHLPEVTEPTQVRPLSSGSRAPPCPQA